MNPSIRRLPSSTIATLFALFLCIFSMHAEAKPADLNCDGMADVSDVQLVIFQALGLPLSSVIDANNDGIHDDCPLSPCGEGTVQDDTTGNCVIDSVFLQHSKETAFAAGVDSVDISTDNAASFDAGVASVDTSAFIQQGYNQGVASVELPVLDLSGVNLTGVDFSDANISEWSFFRGAIKYADMTNAVLKNVDFSDAELQSTKFIGADLTDAILGGTDLTGTVWTDATCPDGTAANDNGGNCCNHMNGQEPWKGCL